MKQLTDADIFNPNFQLIPIEDISKGYLFGDEAYVEQLAADGELGAVRINGSTLITPWSYYAYTLPYVNLDVLIFGLDSFFGYLDKDYFNIYDIADKLYLPDETVAELFNEGHLRPYIKGGEIVCTVRDFFVFIRSLEGKEELFV